MRVLRGSLLVIAAGTSTLVAYVFLTLCSVLYIEARDTGEAADVIMVMGAAQYDGRPSPQLAARLDHALLLFNEGRAPVIAVTGGKRPGDRYTEAEASRRYLVARGVDEEAILAEASGASTWQSVSKLHLFCSMKGCGACLSLPTGTTFSGRFYRCGRQAFTRREVLLAQVPWWGFAPCHTPQKRQLGLLPAG
jgi:hypothetical protein